MTLPVVSIVVPAFNQSTYLAEALASVLSQTYPHFEVLIVDDGSTDDTLAMITRMAESDSRIKVIAQVNDGTFGLGARNWGMLNACGEWIALLDQDDRWHPDKLAKQIDFMQQHAEVRCVYSRVNFMDASGVVYGQQSPCAPVLGYAELLRGNVLYVSSALFSRKLLAVAGLPNESAGYADWALLLGLARHTPIYCLDECLVDYRIQPDSFQQSQMVARPMEYARDHLRVVESQVTRCREGGPIFTMAYRASIRRHAKFYLRAAEVYLSRCQWLEFWKAGSLAVRSTEGAGERVMNILRFLFRIPPKAMQLRNKNTAVSLRKPDK